MGQSQEGNSAYKITAVAHAMHDSLRRCTVHGSPSTVRSPQSTVCSLQSAVCSPSALHLLAKLLATSEMTAGKRPGVCVYAEAKESAPKRLLLSQNLKLIICRIRLGLVWSPPPAMISPT